MQEIFTGPYFCAEQTTRWYDAVETIPDGPTTKLMQELAKKHEMVIVVPIYEEDEHRRLLQHRRRDRRRRHATSASTARTTSRTARRASGRSSTSAPATSAIRSSRRSTPRSASTSATTGTFPEGARELGLNGAEIVFNPSATVAGLSEYLWKLEQPAHAVANAYLRRRDQPRGLRGAVEHRRVLRPELLLRSARPDSWRRRRATRTSWSPPSSTSTRSARCGTSGSSTATAGRRRTWAGQALTATGLMTRGLRQRGQGSYRAAPAASPLTDGMPWPGSGRAAVRL